MKTIQMYNRETGLSLKLEISTTSDDESFWGSHLITQAIIELISSADLGGWEKYPDTELQPLGFHTAIMQALIESIKVDLPEGYPIREAMIELVDDALASLPLDSESEDELDELDE
jgi:hypothetical protein